MMIKGEINGSNNLNACIIRRRKRKYIPVDRSVDQGAHYITFESDAYR